MEALKVNDDSEVTSLLEKHGITQETVDALKGAHVGRNLYVMNDFPIVFMSATKAQTQRLLSKTVGVERQRHLEELSAFLVVHPDKQEYQALLNTYPLLWDPIMESVVSIARMQEPDAKKL